MTPNCLLSGGLALLTAFAAAAQTPVTLNTTPTRIVGHSPETLVPITTAPNLVEGRELWSPQGIALDTSISPNRLYIADTNNNRVLAWGNAQSFRNGQKADLVIGQTDFLHTTAGGPGTSGGFSTGLHSPMGLVVDKSGNLYIADMGNNRVLRFPAPFTQQNGQFPDLVVGQPNFTTKTAATSDSGLALSLNSFVSGIALDASGNLWVVDSGNRRVLRYAATDLASGTNAPKANLVLGQESFESVQANVTDKTVTTANVFAVPGGIAFDAAGNLFVTDVLVSSGSYTVSRVLVFKPPFITNQSAARIMGVYTGTDKDVGNKTLMAGPTATFFLPDKRIGVVDGGSSRILIFKALDEWEDQATTFSPPAVLQFGQPDFSKRLPNGATGTYAPPPTASTFYTPMAAVFSGSELFLTDAGNNRVLALAWTGSAFAPANRVLGQDSLSASAPNLVEGREFAFLTPASSSSVAVDAGVALDETGDTPRLYVADTYNNRILGYRDFRKVRAGKPFDQADIVIGQPDFSSTMPNVTGNPDAPTASSLAYPSGVLVDANGDLWVADRGNGRVLRFPKPFANPTQLPQADVVLGQRNFTQKITDPSRTTLAQPYGLAMSAPGLLVSDASTNRVLLFPFNSAGGFTSADNGKAATKVWGQPDFLSISSGNTDYRMNSPHHLATDTQGRLYVADSGNNRVLIFGDVRSAPETGAQPLLPLDGLSAPRGLFVNQMTGEFWVAEGGSSTVKRFLQYEKLILTRTPVFTAYSGPNALAVAQDQYGDLVIADASSRVSLYFPAMQAMNGANFLASRTALAPGMLAAVCAANTACKSGASAFGPDTATIVGAENPYPMPKTLADTQVLFNGQPVPLYTVSPAQISFVVPMGAPTTGTADLQVMQVSTGRIYAAATVQMTTASPGIMMLTWDGNLRQAAAVNLADATVNGASNPAARGSYIQVYATGLGYVPGAPEDGAAITSVLTPTGKLRANVNLIYLEDYTPNPADRPKEEWLAAAMVYPGIWAINIWVPSGVPANKQVPLLITYNDMPSTDGTTVTTINVK